MPETTAPTFPSAQLSPLQDIASQILDARDVESDPVRLARDLLVGFSSVCLRAGLDGVLAHVGLLDDPDASERPAVRAALAAKLATKADFDPRGPRKAMPRQLGDCVLATLGLGVADEVDRTILLGGDVREQVAAALQAVMERELGIPKIREDIIAWARARCDEEQRSVFNKIVEQLDEAGLRMIKQPKVPIHVAQAIQLQLTDARQAVVAHAVNAALEAATPILARASADAAARLDQPITLRLTPRDVAVRRATDPRAAKVPSLVTQALLADLTELARLAWVTQERPARPYSPRDTFAVGELIEHPKFGRGTVRSVALQRVEVEFADGKVALVHARG